MEKEIRQCINCGKQFVVSKYRKCFCSDICKNVYDIENESNNNVTKSISSYRECKQCGNRFIAKSWNQKYCSIDCRKEALGIVSFDNSEKNCKQCGKKFVPKNSRQIYCYECRVNFATQKNITEIRCCEYCGKEFTWYSKKATQKYCCDECRIAATKKNAKKSSIAKNGNSSLEYIVKQKVEEIIAYLYSSGNDFNGQAIDYWQVGTISDKTREEVLERDNHQCQVCMRNTNLHIHHLVKRKNGGDHSPNNLITLCASCHRHIETGDVEHAINKCLKNAKKYYYDDDKVNDKRFYLASIIAELEKAFDELEEDGVNNEYLLNLDNIIDTLEQI